MVYIVFVFFIINWYIKHSKLYARLNFKASKTQNRVNRTTQKK
jgi:hypothetical protein